MKRNKVKNYVTISGLTCLWVITIVAFLKMEITENLFILIFTLFSNTITGITTYYFNRKESEKNDISRIQE